MKVQFTESVQVQLMAAGHHQVVVALGTTGLQGWIKDNVVPVILLILACVMLFASGKGDLAKLMKVGGGILVSLAFLGMALTGAGVKWGSALSGLFN